jgi:hypothetical protein
MKRVLLILVLVLGSTATGQQQSTAQKQPTPKPTPSPSPSTSRGVPTIRVWVDTEYGFYHCPNTKLYGKTKQGVYMTQKQAQDRGYRPAYGTFCNTTPKAPTKTIKKV